jgi:hypothetical protein
MINKSTPYYIDNNSDAWKWKIQVPYKFPKLIDIPSSTLALQKPGIDGQEFQVVMDTNEFSKNAIVSVGSRQYGPRWYVIKDPQPWNTGYIYTMTLVTDNPTVDFVSSTFLQIGLELELVDAAIGEFDQDLLGLPRLVKKSQCLNLLGSAYGYEHKITEWADDRTMRDANGNPADILVHTKKRNEFL